MNLKDCIQLTQDLIAIRSLSGEEAPAIDFTADFLLAKGWEVSSQKVTAERRNILATRAENPQIVFTTHLDVVPGSDDQFTPEVRDSKIFGRGACDAKGVAASMITAAEMLSDAENLALLFVVGEELDGIGAKTAAKNLPNNFFKYLVNGEPTESKLMLGHKGGLGFSVDIEGEACHSGYPELGKDANAEALRLAVKLLGQDFGVNDTFGPATINLGEIAGGVASNVVSPRATIKGLIRTVLSPQDTRVRLEEVLGERTYEVNYEMPPISLLTIDGFETGMASYCTDVPFLEPLAEECLMYGPGSIHQAHTKEEFLAISDMEKAIGDYIRLYKALNERI